MGSASGLCSLCCSCASCLGWVWCPHLSWVTDVPTWLPSTGTWQRAAQGENQADSPVTSAAKYSKVLLFLNYLCSPSRVSSHCSVLIRDHCRALPLSHRPPSFCSRLVTMWNLVSLHLRESSGKTLIHLKTGVPPKTSPAALSHSRPQTPLD